MRRIARWLGPEVWAGVAWAVAVASPANALGARFGGPPCVLDKCLNGRSTPPRPAAPSAEPQDSAGTGGFRGPLAPGAFDFYVLALSWSPGFCEMGGSEKSPQQCEPGGRLGFVVHGLWPQNTRGYPSDCDTSAGSPSRLVLDSVRGVYPNEGLARYEWRKHGTCTGLSPTAYFADVRRARAVVTIPEAFRAPDDQRSLAPLDIARAFADANPGLRPDSMAVTCRSNVLGEVRICMSRDLRGFVPCPEVARASCRRPVEVPPVL